MGMLEGAWRGFWECGYTNIQIHYIFTSEIRMSKDNKLLKITRWQECLIINHNTAGNPLASFASFSFGLLVAILGIGGWLPSFQNSQKEGSQDLYSFISRALSFILCHLYELRNAPIRPKSDKKSLHQPVVPNEATKSSNSLHQNVVHRNTTLLETILSITNSNFVNDAGGAMSNTSRPFISFGAYTIPGISKCYVLPTWPDHDVKIMTFIQRQRMKTLTWSLHECIGQAAVMATTQKRKRHCHKSHSRPW